MIALFSRWQLKNGCPPELETALDDLAAVVEREEPGTLVFSIGTPSSHPPIGPPPEYAVSSDPEAAPAASRHEIVFFEVYRDAEAFSAHLRGPYRRFIDANRHYFQTPWQGHPRPDITYLDPRSILVRSALARA